MTKEVKGKVFYTVEKIDFRPDKKHYNFNGEGTEAKYAMRYGYSDVEPFEVIEVIGKNKLKIRSMKAEVTKVPTAHIGGFSAHFENHEQEWELTSDIEGRERTISLRKDGRFYRVGSPMGTGSERYALSNEPFKFYDYNF